MIRSTLTERWQTTIPAAIRKALRLKPRQQLTYELVDGGVLIRGQCGSLDDYYGCLGDDAQAGTKAEERRAARESRVARYTQPNPPA
ncbi:MAG: type II toxin-antitoxin system PrlF family antitoxin [Planctomycetota bacterium]